MVRRRLADISHYWRVTRFLFWTLWYLLRGLLGPNLSTWHREDFDKIIKKWSEKMLSLTKCRLQVHNPFKIHFNPKKRYVIVANHSSALDIPLGFLALPDFSIRMLAKVELSKIPLFGTTLKKAQFPFVTRQDRQLAKRQLLKTRSLMNDGISVWIFPEGTRSKDSRIGPLKKGAFITAIETQAQLLPIYIRGADRIMPSQSMRIRLHQVVDVFIGQPIDASRYSVAERNQLLTKLQNQWRAMEQPATMQQTTLEKLAGNHSTLETVSS